MVHQMEGYAKDKSMESEKQKWSEERRGEGLSLGPPQSHHRAKSQDAGLHPG